MVNLRFNLNKGGCGLSYKEKLIEVQEAIDLAAAEVKRNTKDISLVAVSKTQPIEKIEKLISLGHRVFGENRVQEAKTKWKPLKSKYDGLELHLIGRFRQIRSKKQLLFSMS